MVKRGIVLASAVVLALALQVGRVSAFDSPLPTPPEVTPAPPPPRPSPPAYVAPTWHTQADAHHRPAHDPYAKHSRGKASAGVTRTVGSPLTLASVDAVGWLWVVAVEVEVK